MVLAPCMVASPVSHAAAAGEWKTYSEGITALRLMYPTGWAVTAQPQIDVPFKIGGTTASGFAGELEIHIAAATTDITDVFKAVQSNVWPKLKDFKEVTGSEGNWGRNALFHGPWREISFKIGDLAVRQRWYFFRYNKQNFMLVFTAPDGGWAKVLPIFSQILTTLEPSPRSKMIKSNSESTNSGAASSKAIQSWDLAALQDDALLPLRLSYPIGWKVKKQTHGDDREWKIDGKNSSGHEAEMHVWSVPRGDFSLDRFVESVEDQYFKPLKNYQKLNSGRRIVGGADGITTSLTFATDEGFPGKMDVLYFADRDRFYGVSLMTVAWSQQEMRNLFDRLYGTIKL
jgi:hypothetical protein